VITVIPQPDFAPFFVDRHQRENGGHGNTPGSPRGCQPRYRRGGSDGDQLRVLELFAPRRIAVSDLRTKPARDIRWPSRRDAATPARYCARTRKLTSDQESTIRVLAATRSLRSLAADFGVSHETIRSVIRERHGNTGM
jgi:hypothetical protein